MPDIPSLLIIISLALLFLERHFRNRNDDRLPYPPGPRPLPVIGNIRDIPRILPWITYSDWQKKYGDIVHINAIGQHIIILNSANVATDLLEKRSGNYSDRPDVPMANMTGWTSLNVAVIRYGDLWRKHRRLFHQKFRGGVVPAFQPLNLTKSRELLRNLLNSPEEFALHCRHFPASAIVYIAYGHEIALRQDPLVIVMDEAVRMISETFLLGAQLVNIFPILRHVPRWMPGAGFKRMAQKCQDKVNEMQDMPFNSVRGRLVAGTAVPSWTTELLEKNDAKGGNKDEEDIIKAVAATSFAVATDTSTSSLKSFILAMTLYPEVQARAQAEIDAIIGDGRLPNFDDRESLPFVEALCREILRWRPPVPLGIPHATLEDDIYDGYSIPRGTMVLTNIWAMCYDERIFTEPHKFMPERFLAADGSVIDSPIPTFGFGRRICVGRSLAEATLWIATVSILSMFNITKARDEAGREIEVSGVYSDSTISHPLPFQCSITPRSQRTRQLIQSTFKSDSQLPN